MTKTNLEIEEQLDKELDAWLETNEHKYNCTSYNEGQYCCLDNKSSALGGKIGRDWVKKFIQALLQQRMDEIREELPKYGCNCKPQSHCCFRLEKVLNIIKSVDKNK